MDFWSRYLSIEGIYKDKLDKTLTQVLSQKLLIDPQKKVKGLLLGELGELAYFRGPPERGSEAFFARRLACW